MDARLPVTGISVERHAPARPTTIVRLLREALLIAAGTAFLALTARISLPLPFSPVPITGQTLGVLVVGALYGPTRGAATVLAYLVEGAAGAPVFAAGRAGLSVLAGPTGGFLVGFVPAAAIAGFAGARRRAALRLAILLLATAAVYACGVPWLMAVTGLPLAAALAAGALPFLPGDVLKAGLAGGVTPAGARLLRLR
ncbi:MAG TPA: biotin transporter BioY [Chloroflexota bacterium]|nr:biotin transporter BioY [Chloroflexota bacterium]